MTKYEYLAELEKKLDMLSYEDKNQALEYYESYFEDAGKENIAKVIEELGSPGALYFIVSKNADGKANYSYDTSSDEEVPYKLNFKLEELIENEI